MDTLADAEKFVNQYKSTLSTLFGWADRHKKKVRKKGTAYTYFGRPRRLRYYFSHPDSGKRAFAYRSAINTVIQGAGSDIMKIAMIKVYDNVLTNDKYKDDARFISTIHDEANFAVRKSKMEEVIPVLMKNMELSVPNWPVDMECDFELGNNWGHCFEFVNDEKTGEYRPNWEPAEEHGM